MQNGKKFVHLEQLIIYYTPWDDYFLEYSFLVVTNRTFFICKWFTHSRVVHRPTNTCGERKATPDYNIRSSLPGTSGTKVATVPLHPASILCPLFATDVNEWLYQWPTKDNGFRLCNVSWLEFGCPCSSLRVGHHRIRHYSHLHPIYIFLSIQIKCNQIKIDLGITTTDDTMLENKVMFPSPWKDIQHIH